MTEVQAAHMLELLAVLAALGVLNLAALLFVFGVWSVARA